MCVPAAYLADPPERERLDHETRAQHDRCSLHNLQHRHRPAERVVGSVAGARGADRSRELADRTERETSPEQALAHVQPASVRVAGAQPRAREREASGSATQRKPDPRAAQHHRRHPPLDPQRPWRFQIHPHVPLLLLPHLSLLSFSLPLPQPCVRLTAAHPVLLVLPPPSSSPRDLVATCLEHWLAQALASSYPARSLRAPHRVDHHTGSEPRV
eukprot:2988250-Rhodomonas_salina.1